MLFQVRSCRWGDVAEGHIIWVRCFLRVFDGKRLEGVPKESHSLSGLQILQSV